VRVLERNNIRRILASTILVTAVIVQSAPGAAAQEVRNTSYVTKSGERVLRIETVVPASTENVWKAWTTPSGLSKWIAPVVAIDLKIGGSISTNYDEKATIGNAGVTRAGPGDEQLFLQNMKDIFFEYDKYSVPQNERTAVEKDARFLAAHPNYKLLISGHCDERGSEDYNLALGDNRANTVREQLERLGISAGRIRTISYGKEKPFCQEETEACWQLNRRAHFSMQP
jgi:peptidoglycan-associated lipoprotein